VCAADEKLQVPGVLFNVKANVVGGGNMVEVYGYKANENNALHIWSLCEVLPGWFPVQHATDKV